MEIKTILKQRDLKPVILIDYDRSKNKKIIDLIKEIESVNNNIYFFSKNKIIKKLGLKELFGFLKTDINQKISDLPDFKDPIIYDDFSLFQIYNIMRNKYDSLPIISSKTMQVLGELEYRILSKKFYDILLKNDLGVFDKKTFELILEKNNFITEKIGMFGIVPINLSILEKIYGTNNTTKVLRQAGSIIEKTLRRIDMVFWVDKYFLVLTFNTPSEVLKKIEIRIITQLKPLENGEPPLTFIAKKIAIPEEEENLITALNKIKYEISKEAQKNNFF